MNVAASSSLADDLWPLMGPFSGLFVGGVTLRSCQAELAPPEGVRLVENAWVSPQDWKLLVGMDGPAKLESHRGELLAWKGTGEVPRDGLMALASDSSFLVCHPWDLLRVNEQVVGAIEESRWGEQTWEPVVEGVLQVGKGTRLLPGVFVEGRVVIGEDCKIGPNCYLRGSTAIGDGCHIGQAVEIKNSIIGAHTAIGHLSYVGDSVIGSRVNFGAGTITSNLRHDGRNHRSMVQGHLIETGRRKLGAIVGDGVYTGIQTAIYPGRKLGPGITTVPGEVVDRDKH